MLKFRVSSPMIMMILSVKKLMYKLDELWSVEITVWAEDVQTMFSVWRLLYKFLKVVACQ